MEASPRWPVIALAAVAVLAPFNIDPAVNGWTDLQLRPLVVVGLAVALAVTAHGVRARAARPDWVDGVAYFWLAAIWLAVVFGDSTVTGAAGAARISVVVLLIPAVRAAVRTNDDVIVVLRSVAAGSLLGASLGLVIWLVDAEAASRLFVGTVTKLGPYDRLTQPWAHANGAAMALAATGATVALLPNRWLRAGSFAVVACALVATISRGGLLGAVAAMVVWVAVQRDLRSVRLVGSVVAVAAVAFALSAGWTTRADQLGEEAFYNVDLDAPMAFMLEDDARLVDIAITNDSTASWPRSGPDRVMISARWIGHDGLVWNEDRWQLPHDLAPGKSLQTGLTVTTRLPPGSYEVRWDLLIDGVAYFDQFLGQPPVVSQVEIARSPIAPDTVTTYPYVERLVRDDRIDTWRLAWQEFRSSPLVGVGPNQFGERSQEELRSQGRLASTHAHNIALEPLVTWGVVGAVPMFVLGATALLRSLALAWKKRTVAATVVAASLAAVVTHGMVDWPLVVVTTGIPVGLLVGLALAETSEP